MDSIAAQNTSFAMVCKLHSRSATTAQTHQHGRALWLTGGWCLRLRLGSGAHSATLARSSFTACFHLSWLLRCLSLRLWNSGLVSLWLTAGRGLLFSLSRGAVAALSRTVEVLP